MREHRSSAPTGHRRKRGLRTAVVAACALLLLLSGTAWAMGLVPFATPPWASGTTVLVLGSDSRSGSNGDLAAGPDDSERADSQVLVHLDPRGSSATAVSLPRDTVVDRPECTGSDGGSVPGSSSEPLGNAFAIGGAECTLAAVEETTGVGVDHYVVLDFHSVAELSTVVGGVEVTVPDDIEPGHADGLEPGRHRLAGEEAVAFLRLRHAGDDHSDLRRIERQQEFLGGLFEAATEDGLLSDPGRARALVGTVLEEVETDPGLQEPTTLARLLMEQSGMGEEDVRIVTAPVQESALRPDAWVEFAPEADEVWRELG